MNLQYSGEYELHQSLFYTWSYLNQIGLGRKANESKV